ncbi:4a-hydroxytetrahydrobiopterin dehydratase [Leptolyngbyaceae cyanobacterium CCMR0082]|uniref:Putative pterin-4-alpha-carbinolamine dehydratase n=2 Tax=Adonisia turfae TaxID=2950184 RepID=A0A6M0S7U4_9CYAN|nr:4a-hydroxytetrahydrobiopterin dehydratase [Adonisia turfae]NEZ57248.1 4a-hydroxytetrahydrobiopterin dehydratase [Adonisia turfae CCMR0081]NEZ64466.1 4a-hydroxytetrahydrobiopterin dehydratase [Adonisia turfae CCMR0082]
MPTLLSSTEIQTRLTTLPDWTLEDTSIQMILTFKNFIEAIAYINKVVEPAEAAGHHPDISISYNRVIISLTTHDAGGLTQQDFNLAQTLSQLA